MEFLSSILVMIASIPVIGHLVSRKFLRKFLKIQYSTHFSFNDGILLDVSSEKTIEDYFDNDGIVNMFSSISISFENSGNAGSVKIAPFVYVRTYYKAELPDHTYTYVEPKDGIGGGGVPRYLWGVLDRGIQEISCASYISDEFHIERDQAPPILPARREYEFFSLAPGEFETFILALEIEPGHIYKFDIGVPVKINGKQEIIWSEKKFRMAVPIQTIFVRPKNIDLWDGEIDLGNTQENYRQGPIVRWVDQDMAAGHFLSPSRYDKGIADVIKVACRKYGKSEFDIMPEPVKINQQEVNDIRQRLESFNSNL